MLVNALFPLQCVHCPTYGSLCCDVCFLQLQNESNQHPANKHDPPNGFEQLITIGSYANPILQSLIIGLKFHGLKGCAEPLGSILAEKLQPILNSQQPAVLIPLPLSRRRQFERGYNQAECIAAAIKQEWPQAPTIQTNFLKRAHRASQTSRSHAQREHNINNAYKGMRHAWRRWLKEQAQPHLTIILIDDVLTTGASMKDAKRALEQAAQHTATQLTFMTCVAAVG